jgi:hypothetical protein
MAAIKIQPVPAPDQAPSILELLISLPFGFHITVVGGAIDAGAQALAGIRVGEDLRERSRAVFHRRLDLHS